MKVAFVLFDRMTSLDFIGFYDPVTRLKSMKIMDDLEWQLCAMTETVVDDRGLRIEANQVVSPSTPTTWCFFQAGLAPEPSSEIRHSCMATKRPISSSKGLRMHRRLLMGAAGFLHGRRPQPIRVV
jgi:cyclohexyl-isocyanide hydratase